MAVDVFHARKPVVYDKAALDREFDAIERHQRSGLWTPGVSFGGGTTGITYTIQAGEYARIGNQILARGFVTLSSKGSATGAVRITGLPFAIASGNQSHSAAALRLEAVTFANQFMGYGDPGTTTVKLEEITEAGVVTELDDTNFVDTSSVVVSVTYQTT